jgi:hypothetical protein
VNSSITVDTATVKSGGRILHDNNTNAKTNWVEIHASALTVNAGGTINVDGAGYSATNGPGGAVAASGNGGAHGGPGTGAAGIATTEYDSIIAPNDLGSGGATQRGGGMIKLYITGALSNAGGIWARGTTAGCAATEGAGAGGTIYIETGTYTGNGQIYAYGGHWGGCASGAGSGGRIALIHTDAGSATAKPNGWAADVQFWGGDRGSNWTDAGAGTAYYKNLNNGKQEVWVTGANSEHVVTTLADTMWDNTTIDVHVSGAGTTMKMTGTNSGTKDMYIDSGGRWLSNSAISVNSVLVSSGGLIYHDVNTTAKTNFIDITAATNITVAVGGNINADYAGYSATNGPGAGTACNTGGGHGGNGANFGNCAGGGAANDTAVNPTDMGSGGLSSAGGGFVKLTVTGTLDVNGTISVNGAACAGGCGSGGTINIGTNIFRGVGTIRANGGSGGAGGGSGGLIYVGNVVRTNWTGTAQVLAGATGAPAAQAGVLTYAP